MKGVTTHATEKQSQSLERGTTGFALVRLDGLIDSRLAGGNDQVGSVGVTDDAAEQT